MKKIAIILSMITIAATAYAQTHVGSLPDRGTVNLTADSVVMFTSATTYRVSLGQILQPHTDSIADIRAALDWIGDTLDAHRTDINAGGGGGGEIDTFGTPATNGIAFFHAANKLRGESYFDYDFDFDPVSAGGLIRLGDYTPGTGSADYAIGIARQITGDGNTMYSDGNAHAFLDESYINRSNTTGGGIGYNSFDGKITIGGTYNYDHFAGFQERMVYGSSGTLARMTSYQSLPTNNGGTITRRVGLEVRDVLGSGTVTHNYGIYVKNLTRGTNNVALFVGQSPDDDDTDIDMNLIRAGVTGYPDLYWDESADGFGFDKPLLLPEIATPGSAAPSGTGLWYIDSADGKPKVMNDGGTEYDLTSAGGGSVSFGSENEIPTTNSATDDFDYSSGFTFDGSTFNVTGDAVFDLSGRAAPYYTPGSGNTFSVGNTNVIGGIGVVEIAGRRNTSATVGVLAFANYSSSNADKRIAQLQVAADTDMDEGYFRFNIWDEDASAVGMLNMYHDSVVFMPDGTTTVEIVPGYVRPPIGGGASLGSSANVWDTIYTDNLYFTNRNYAIETSGNDMVFTDQSNPTGVTLSSLVGGGGSVSFGTDNQIPFTNSGGTDFDYSSNFRWSGTQLYLGVDSAMTDGDDIERLDGQSHSLFYTDGSGDMQNLTMGTNGYVLTSNGPTVAPSWQEETDAVGDSVTVLWNEVFDPDSVQMTDIVRLLEDTATLWTWALTDSAQFETGKKFGLFYHHGPDTMYVVSGRVVCPTGSPDFTYNVHFAADISGTDTDVYTTAVQVTGSDATSTGEVDTPNTADIPPGNWVWFQLYDVTAKPPDGASFSFPGYEY